MVVSLTWGLVAELQSLAGGGEKHNALTTDLSPQSLTVFSDGLYLNLTNSARLAVQPAPPDTLDPSFPSANKKPEVVWPVLGRGKVVRDRSPSCQSKGDEDEMKPDSM